MPPSIEETNKNVLPNKRPSRWRKSLYILIGVLLAGAIAAGVVVVFYPSVVLDYAIEPKLKQLISDRLGGKYSLTMDSIFFSPGKDSLIIIGTHITENANDTAVGMRMPLDRLTTDTVIVAGLDYWRLILQKGLFAANVTIRSPKIYLRTGAMPKFEKGFFPDFLPVISSRQITLENAQLFFSDKANELRLGRGVNVGNASVILKDFYLDEPTLKNPNSTFFCKSATFHASDISHLDSLNSTDMHIAFIDGNLIDSSLEVSQIEMIAPIEEVRHLAVAGMTANGVDWTSAMAGKGLHIRTVSVRTPHVELQPLADIKSTSATTRRVTATELIPLPNLVPNVKVASFEVTNAEISTWLPKSKEETIIKPLNASLTDLAIDKSTPFSNVSSFFSRKAVFSINDQTNLKTSYGDITIASIKGTQEYIKTSNIAFRPTTKALANDIRLVSMESAQIFGLDFWKLFRREGFISKSVVVTRPGIYLYPASSGPVTDLKSTLRKNPLDQIRGYTEYPLPDIIPVASIGTVTVVGGGIYGIHFLDDPAALSARGDSISALQLSLKNFKLDKSSWAAGRGTLFASGGTFSIGSFSHVRSGLEYDYRIGTMSGDLAKGTMTMKSITVRPGLKAVEYCNGFVCRKEYIGLAVPSIEVSGVSFDRVLKGEGLFAKNVSLDNWDLTIYGDKRKPEDEKKTVEVYPHEIFQYVKMPFAVNTITVRNGGILYGEHWPEVDEPGQISIDTINAVIGPVSNQMPIDSPTYVNGTMKVMAQAPVKYKIAYELNNPEFNLEMLGEAGRADASLFNNFLGKIEPFTLSGNIRSVEFGLKVKDTTLTGRVIPVYDSLNVMFYRWDKFPPGVFSWLANSIFMRSHNTTDGNNTLAIGEINSPIDRSTNLYWSLWHPIRSAIGDVVRIPEWVW